MEKCKSAWHRVFNRAGRASSAFLLFFVLLAGSLWGQITGNTTVCQNNVYTYSVPEVEGEFYTWVASGGTVVSATSTENEVNIMWTGIGTQTLTLSTQPGNLTTQLSVTVLTSPVPYLLPTDNLYCSGGEDYDEIKKQTGGIKVIDGKEVIGVSNYIPPYERGLPCVVACEGSAVTYNTPLHAGSTYEWIVSGAVNYTIDNNQITVVWGAPGFGNIILTETNQAGCSISDDICIEIMDSPEALFSTFPLAVANTINICSGQTVFFNDQSVGGSTWAWDFGDGYVSSLENPDHTYLLPGTYTVTMTVSNFAVGTTAPITIRVPKLDDGREIDEVLNGGGNGGNINGGNLTTDTDINPIKIGVIHYENVTINPEADFTCNCTDTYTMTVVVEELPAPIIECISTVCAGDVATYTSPAECTNFDWDVIGGTILTESGNSVTIKWGDGTTGPGYVTLDVGSCPGYCDGLAVERVSIIPTTLTIDGPQIVCLQSVHKYKLPQVSGMTYNWSVGQGQIIAGQGTNEITVIWVSNVPGTFYVSASFGNDVLGCGGSSSLAVQGVPEILIMGDKRLCEGTSAGSMPNRITAISSYGFGGVSANWSIITPNGTTLTNVQMNSTSLTTYPFNAGPGTYVVIAKPAFGTYCNDQVEMSVTVVARPGAPAGIVGENNVCPNSTYTYYAQGTIANPVFDWTIINGGNPATSATGTSTTVTWGDGTPYELYLTQTYADLPGCTSPATSLIVNDKSFIVLPEISGPANACLGGTSTYTIPTPLNPDAVYQWSVEPASLGTFLTAENGPAMEIAWSTNNQSSATATIKLQIRICGKSYERTYPVNLTGYMPGFVSPQPICVNQPAQFFGPTGTDAGVYFEWTFGNGDQSSVENPVTEFTEPGSYPITLFVRNGSGCEASRSDVVNVSPLPTALISTPDKTGFLSPECGDEPVTANLYALQNTAGTYTYEWFKAGNPTSIGSSNPINVTEIGSYYAVVTDSETGCSETSDLLYLNYVGCGVCEIEPHSKDFTSQILAPTCNEVQFTPVLSSNVVVSSWSFGDLESGSSNYSTANSPTHAFSKAGYFDVYLYVKGPKASNPSDSAICYTQHKVFLPIVANFNYQVSCIGNSTLTQLIDRSGYFNDGSITSYHWDITGPQNMISTDANPLLNLAGGTYTVTLTIQSAISGIQCSKTRTIVVPQSPVSVMNFPSGICPGELVQFESLSTGGIVEYFWDFGQAIATSAFPNPSRVITGTEDRTISLTVTDVYGCQNTSMGTLEVNTPQNGTITAGGPTTFCLGSSVTLTAPAGTNYVWSNGQTTQSIVATVAGSYTVAVTGTNGCRYTTPAVNVSVVSRPNPIISGSTSLCEGQSVTLGTATGMASYRWYFNAEPVSDNNYQLMTVTTASQTFTGTVASSGDYYVAVTNQFGCSANSAPFHVTVNPNPVKPVISVNQAGPYCEGTIYTFSIANPQANIAYVWSTGQISASIQTREAGVYSVTAYNVTGCSVESDAITISEVPDVSSVMVGCYEICNADFPVTIAGPSGYTSYQWYYGTTVYSTNQNLVASDFGVYYLVLTNASGCTTTSGEVIISRLPLAKADLSATIDCCEDEKICQGASASLPIHFVGDGPYTFTYTDGTNTYTVTTSNSLYNLIVTPTKTTTYKLLSVSSANESGCYEVCGQATVVVNDCTALTAAEKRGGKGGNTTAQDCSLNCFSANVTNVEETAQGCRNITMQLTCTSSCQAALSNFGISVQCGTVSNLSNSAGYQMYPVTNDPNTGLTGIKIDNMTDICGSGLTVNYTVCPNENNCSFQLCDPIVAFKAGTCVHYGTAAVPSNFKSIGVAGESTLETSEMAMRVYPNPFSDNLTIDLNLVEKTQVTIEVYDMMGKKLSDIHNGELEAGAAQFNWDAARNAEQVSGGIYYIRTTVNGVVNHTKIMHSK